MTHFSLFLSLMFLSGLVQDYDLDGRKFSREELPGVVARVREWMGDYGKNPAAANRQYGGSFPNWALNIVWQAASSESADLRPTLREIALWQTNVSGLDHRRGVCVQTLDGLWTFGEPAAFFEEVRECYERIPGQALHALWLLAQDPTPARLERCKQIAEALGVTGVENPHARKAVGLVELYEQLLSHTSRLEALSNFDDRARYLLRLAPGLQATDEENMVFWFHVSTVREDWEGKYARRRLRELSEQNPVRVAELLATYDFRESEYQQMDDENRYEYPNLGRPAPPWLPRLRRLICAHLSKPCREHYEKLTQED